MLCLFLTNQCGFECNHCLTNASPGRNKFMTEKVFLKILSTFDNNSYNFCGGEPSRHPQFREFLKEAVLETSEYVRVVTNAEWFINGESYEFFDGEKPDENDYEDLEEFEEAEQEWYDSLSEIDANIGMHCDFEATAETVKFCEAVINAASWRNRSQIEIHISNDEWHRWFISDREIKNAKNLLQNIFDGDNVIICSDDHPNSNYLRRYIIPVGRGKQVYDPADERGICCEYTNICDTENSLFLQNGHVNSDIKDHFEDRFNHLNFFYDGQVAACEGGLYMFANVLKDDYEEIKRKFWVVYRYMQLVFAKCKEEGIKGLEMCLMCQRAFPQFKRFILPSIAGYVEEEAYVNGVRETFRDT